MQPLDSTVSARVSQWLEGNYDEQTKAEIRQLVNDQRNTELTDAFYKDLEFGTGGLRGIMGAGSNRVNKYTIGAATQGLSNYLKKTYPGKELKVVVAHDSRNDSDTLAAITADVFSANDIKVYFFKALRPTPLLSFAIRQLGCQSGVMLTASHNPKEYNGYKAYGADGGQFVTPHDKQVMEEVAKVQSIDDIRFERKAENVEFIDTEMDRLYLDGIKKLSLNPDAIQRQKDLKIVFSPIHGTGITLMPDALKLFGFENVILVDEQIKPDGNFPTVVYPNPEEKEALTLALKKAGETDADLVLATDPDADRVGIAVKNEKGEFELLNGNQTGSLLIYYLLNAWEDKRKLDGNQYIVTTIVTTDLINKIAASKNVPSYNTLTGFKWIGQIMTQFEGKKTFIGGGEESYGYLVGEMIRDKDAIVSGVFIAEMAAYFKDKGSDLYHAMMDMYTEYGFYKEKLVSITKQGKSGAEEIKAMMQRFRENPPATLGGSAVTTLRDYEMRKETEMASGKVSDLELPKSDVLQFITADGDVISARPSGTEPKIKFYCSVRTELKNRQAYRDTEAQLSAKVDAIMKDLNV